MALGADAPAAAEEAPPPLVVFAAASMTEAVAAVAARLQGETGRETRAAFASSSTLARQIEHGAPASVFVSANPAWMDRLEERGLLAPGARRDIAANALVLVTAPGRAGALPEGFAPALLAALGEDGRLALGDPLHVPAGVYAMQALESLGLAAALEPRLARAADVRGVLALVERGEAPAGIVYATDAAVSGRVEAARTVPPALHDPVVYPAAIVAAGDSAAARAFLAFLSGAEGRAILAERGFLPPPDPLTP